MSTEETRAYARGYNTGSRGRWPAHRPPTPPEPVVAAIVEAGRKLRDGVDSYLATIDPDDPLQETLGRGIDEWDAAMVGLDQWLKHGTEQS